MRGPAALAVLAVVGLAQVAAAQGDGTKAEEQAIVSPMQGDLAAWRAETRKVEALAKEGGVPKEDRLGSKGGAVARLGVEGSVVVTLKGVEPSAEQGLSVEKEGKKIVLKLIRGSAVVESAEADVAMQTPQGRIEGHGVSFLVEIANGTARVVSLDGKPSFTNDLGAVEIPAGSVTVARGGAPPGKPAPGGTTVAWMDAWEAPGNLIGNAGFEQGLDGWKSGLGRNATAPYSLLDPQIDGKILHGGKQSALIAYEARQYGSGYSALVRSQATLLAKGGRYFLRVWIRTDAHTNGGKDSPVEVGLGFSSGGKNVPQVHESVPCPDAQGTWRCCRHLFTAQEADDTVLIDFVQAGRGVLGGKVWVDDLYLGRVSETSQDGKGK